MDEGTQALTNYCCAFCGNAYQLKAHSNPSVARQTFGKQPL
jgi:hypothetical protein